MRFKLLYTIIFLLSFIQNSNSENNLASVDNIFHIGKMDSYNKILVKVRIIPIHYLFLRTKILSFFLKRERKPF